MGGDYHDLASGSFHTEQMTVYCRLYRLSGCQPVVKDLYIAVRVRPRKREVHDADRAAPTRQRDVNNHLSCRPGICLASRRSGYEPIGASFACKVRLVAGICPPKYLNTHNSTDS